jgi:acyl-CoA dehydrogenase
VFAREVMCPLGLELDRVEPEEVAAGRSPVYEFARQAYALGLTRMTIPKELGGLGLSRKAECIITEELAAGDSGLASILFLAAFPFNYALKFGSPELIEELAKPYFAGKRPDWIGSWSITEMAHGSDRGSQRPIRAWSRAAARCTRASTVTAGS